MKDLSLYIHIPFCKTICTFCNFLTFAHKSKWIPEYIESLKQEIELKAQQHSAYQVVTIYFGGGTPSLIDPKYIAETIESIKQNFNCVADLEISIETNPESLDLERLQIYQKAGVKRISVGVQSLNNQTLLKVARPHNGEQALKALQLLKDFGWENFACDLIMGLPYQNHLEFQEHLSKILKFSPKHLSAYFLSYDTKRIDTFIKDSPDEDEQIKMYWDLQEKLSAAGFNHYEVSNYALPNFECQHNLRYWNQREYLGLGLGAHSFMSNTVFDNTRDFDLYLKNPLAIESEEKLDSEILRMDYIMLSLRKLEGLNLIEYEERYGNVHQLMNAAKDFLQNKDLKIKFDYKKRAANLYPTAQGFLIIDFITKKLLA